MPQLILKVNQESKDVSILENDELIFKMTLEEAVDLREQFKEKIPSKKEYETDEEE